MDDGAAITLFIGLAIPFGWDAVKEDGWRRYGAGALAGAFLLLAALWFPLKGLFPEVATIVSGVATTSSTWFTLFILVAAMAILSGPAFRSGGARSPSPFAVPPEPQQRQATENKSELLNIEARVKSRLDDFTRHLNGMEKTISVNYTAAKDLTSSLENAYLGQMAQLRHEIKPLVGSSKSMQADLLFILYFSLENLVAEIVRRLVAEAPIIDEMMPPLDSEERRLLHEKATEYLQKVSSNLNGSHTGSRVDGTIHSSGVSAENRLRQIAVGDRPSIDALEFREHFILASQVIAVVQFLERRAKEASEATAGNLGPLITRYQEREKSSKG